MLVYRIANQLYINDLSGEGAKLTGGRWNDKGVPVLYTGSSLSLCAWEYFVHLPPKIVPKQNTFSYAVIEIPTDSMLEISPSSLPKNWKNTAKILPQITNNWIEKRQSLALKVPSSIIESEYNFLLNPAFPSYFDLVKIIEIKHNFTFDHRAFGKKIKL